MAISLKKGQGVSLKKSEYDLSMVTIGLGWDINEEKQGLLKSLFKKNEEYDLDVVAFLCDSSGKVQNLGGVDEKNRVTLVGGDIVFFNSLRHSSGCIWLTGDNRTGMAMATTNKLWPSSTTCRTSTKRLRSWSRYTKARKRTKTLAR